MSPPETPDADAEPGSALVDVLGVVPRLVDRTRRQAEFLGSVISVLTCAAASPTPTEATEGTDRDDGAAGAEESVDVLSVLARPADGAGGTTSGATAEAPAGTDPAPTPDGPGRPERPTPTPAPALESLAIEEYDSLAASQVVPRLSTLDQDELRAVGAYERATRHRQTILNRVAQLLAT